MDNITKIIFFIARPLGVFYAQVMRLRALCYLHDIFPRYKATVPVISVGNLTMGGSGKTPVVIHLARFLLEQGYKPAVISRGYGGKAHRPVNIVSDGVSLLLESYQAGDEPRLIAESVPGTIVLTGKKRHLPCQYAIDHYNCDILILDDGFQHMRVRRDIDLVLFNAASLFHHMHVLPGGLLREPFSALDRAHCFLIAGCNHGRPENIERFRSFLESNWPETQTLQTQYLPDSYVDREGKILPLPAVSSPAYGFCGIASPDRFFHTINTLPLDIVGTKRFSDHHHYTPATLARIEKEAIDAGAEILLTTEKDLVKLASLHTNLPLYAIRMEIRTDTSFTVFIRKMIDKHQTS